MNVLLFIDIQSFCDSFIRDITVYGNNVQYSCLSTTIYLGKTDAIDKVEGNSQKCAPSAFKGKPTKHCKISSE